MTWMTRAACRGKTDLFYPSAYRDDTAARRICAGCPVREACLQHALANHETEGIWGGLTPAERENGQPRCRHCDALFVRKAGQPVLFCSVECRDARRRDGQTASHRRRSEERDLTCTICGATFHRRDTSTKTCSPECLSQLLHDQRVKGVA